MWDIVRKALKTNIAFQGGRTTRAAVGEAAQRGFFPECVRRSRRVGGGYLNAVFAGLFFRVCSCFWRRRDQPEATVAPLPGHSHIDPVYDRSPRKRAYLMGGTGNIHFPVSSKNPLVQKFVEQGVGQLHGFWFVEAERRFVKRLVSIPIAALLTGGCRLPTRP